MYVASPSRRATCGIRAKLRLASRVGDSCPTSSSAVTSSFSPSERGGGNACARGGGASFSTPKRDSSSLRISSCNRRTASARAVVRSAVSGSPNLLLNSGKGVGETGPRRRRHLHQRPHGT